EPWQNVVLTLSTTRPAGSVSAPELKPITVDFVPERPPLVQTPAPAREMESAARRRNAPQAMAGAPPPAPPAMDLAAIAERPADAMISDFTATFSVPGRVTVENIGETKRVFIDQAEFEPTLLVRAVPKREERAFLYAKLVL